VQSIVGNLAQKRKTNHDALRTKENKSKTKKLLLHGKKLT
jgi:hypothetical protein